MASAKDDNKYELPGATNLVESRSQPGTSASDFPDLCELQKLARAVPPGPWKAQHPYLRPRGWEVADSTGLNQICENMTAEVAAFIAAANPATLLKIVDRIQNPRMAADDGWISVNEQVPPAQSGKLFSESVLVVDMDSNYPHVRMSELNYDDEGPTVWSGASPTHWKPAPALPGAAWTLPAASVSVNSTTTLPGPLPEPFGFIEVGRGVTEPVYSAEQINRVTHDVTERLTAELATTRTNLQTAVREAWSANAELTKLRAALANPSSVKEDEAPVHIRVARDHIWIVKGVQQFMLAYEWDEQDELEWYLGEIRKVLSSIGLRTNFDPKVEFVQPEHNGNVTDKIQTATGEIDPSQSRSES